MGGPGIVVYALAVIGFIWWVWTRCAAQNRIQVTKKSPPRAPARRRKPRKDDLTEISGIGKVIAGKLNKLGYTRFEQIAAFTKADIEKVDAELKFKGRIKRDKWIAQAKKLSQKTK